MPGTAPKFKKKFSKFLLEVLAVKRKNCGTGPDKKHVETFPHDLIQCESVPLKAAQRFVALECKLCIQNFIENLIKNFKYRVMTRERNPEDKLDEFYRTSYTSEHTYSTT